MITMASVDAWICIQIDRVVFVVFLAQDEEVYK